MDINVVVISGNLTRDAEMRRTASGMCIASFGMAVNDRRKNQSGEWENYPNYVDVTWFGTGAEKCASSLVKGARVTVKGKLRYSSWESKDGQKRSKLEVITEDIVLPPRSAHQSYQQLAVYDSDIPF